ncbi:hypothetical protein LRS10_05985 [Phenylobacterium sp. J426]|uniref:hypothetical protein n=1 Tax=Phenylobacterium sp. J426 TaxID=2898439 RepID=UPI002151B20D|nr:hypothetical protein [Phenylobacterium sp. J426]MCR5873765.1 hypothetical protein [Phenylobacterium sp. J426]
MRAVRAQAAADAVAPPPILCEWVVSIWLQRDPCVESLTGRLACMQGYNTRLEDRDRGSEPVSEATACTPDHPATVAASKRLAQAVAGTSVALFETDMKRRFAPELSYAGVTLRPRTR